MFPVASLDHGLADLVGLFVGQGPLGRPDGDREQQPFLAAAVLLRIAVGLAVQQALQARAGRAGARSRPGRTSGPLRRRSGSSRDRWPGTAIGSRVLRDQLGQLRQHGQIQFGHGGRLRRPNCFRPAAETSPRNPNRWPADAAVRSTSTAIQQRLAGRCRLQSRTSASGSPPALRRRPSRDRNRCRWSAPASTARAASRCSCGR